jgi:hypothetical protein
MAPVRYAHRTLSPSLYNAAGYISKKVSPTVYAAAQALDKRMPSIGRGARYIARQAKAHPNLSMLAMSALLASPLGIGSALTMGSAGLAGTLVPMGVGMLGDRYLSPKHKRLNQALSTALSAGQYALSAGSPVGLTLSGYAAMSNAYKLARMVREKARKRAPRRKN